ncbi:MAG: histidine--tRNA ligase [Campylobacterota bacterium]|nr:histidine--tRNA ligase [Campylobacterota bacterium]
MIQSLRGMNDIMREDYERFEYFIKTASQIASNYGFHYIETPLLEETALFKRGVGESSDIVGKEMYQFIDKGKNDVCLRPEGTAGVVRAFVQKKLDKKGGIHRFFYYGPMFRYERPQKGRLREFHQFGVESFGVSSVLEDASMIMMISDILDALGIGYTLELNSLGCAECMPPYREKLVNFIEANEENICEDCIRRKATNPIRVLDCKNEKCQSTYETAPKLLENLCSTCSEDFEKLKEILESQNIEYKIDTHLVRGLDYYSKSAFEFVSNEIGAQSAIAGGGRYDKLVEFLDGKPTPAVGFAIGIERLLELIKMPSTCRDGFYFGALDEEALLPLLHVTQMVRKKSRAVVEFAPKKFQAHLKNANKLDVKYCCLIGENELQDGTIWVKNMEDGSESSVKKGDVLSLQ